MKFLLVLFCAVTYHYCIGYPIIDGEKLEEVLTGQDTPFEYMLDTTNDISSNDSIPQFLIIAQDVIKSIVKEKIKQDNKNEIFSLGDYSGLGRGIGADHYIDNNRGIEYDHYIDNIRVEDTENALGRGIGDDHYIDNIRVEDTENALGSGIGDDHFIDNIRIEDTGNALGRGIGDDSYIDNNRVEYALNARWRWFFLAIGITLLIKLALYLYRKNKRDTNCEVQHVSKK